MRRAWTSAVWGRENRSRRSSVSLAPGGRRQPVAVLHRSPSSARLLAFQAPPCGLDRALHLCRGGSSRAGRSTSAWSPGDARPGEGGAGVSHEPGDHLGAASPPTARPCSSTSLKSPGVVARRIDVSGRALQEQADRAARGTLRSTIPQVTPGQSADTRGCTCTVTAWQAWLTITHRAAPASGPPPPARRSRGPGVRARPAPGDRSPRAPAAGCGPRPGACRAPAFSVQGTADWNAADAATTSRRSRSTSAHPRAASSSQARVMPSVSGSRVCVGARRAGHSRPGLRTGARMRCAARPRTTGRDRASGRPCRWHRGRGCTPRTRRSGTPRRGRERGSWTPWKYACRGSKPRYGTERGGVTSTREAPTSRRSSRAALTPAPRPRRARPRPCGSRAPCPRRRSLRSAR